MRRAMMSVAAMVAWCAAAEVPTQAEFTAAGNVIADLTEPQMAAVKSGKKKPAEVADYAIVADLRGKVRSENEIVEVLCDKA